MVALDYPVIWSRIIDYERHPPEWIETLLARSGSSLIDVGRDRRVLEPVKLHHPVLQSIFQRITALRSVSLHEVRAPWKLICRSFLAHPAPNLEFLNLTTYSYFDCIYLNPLFADKAPRLRRLHLQRCLIDFSSAVLSNLTQLSVSCIAAFAPNSYPNVAGWLRVLKNIPTLRFLTLDTAISHFTEPEPLPAVDLPHLVLLTIGYGFLQGMSLVDHLNIPPSCGTKFTFDINSNNELNNSNLLSFLSKQLTHWPQDQAGRYLYTRFLKGDQIYFHNFRLHEEFFHDHSFITMLESDEVEAHSRDSKDPIFLLILSLPSDECSLALFNRLLELYSSTFSTTTILDLCLDQETASMATTGGSFSFHSFTNLKTLTLAFKSPLHLLPFFQNSSLPDYPLFPALQTLSLAHTHVDSLCSALVAFLLWRVEIRVPLPEIHLYQSTICIQAAEDLSRLTNLRVSPAEGSFITTKQSCT